MKMAKPFPMKIRPEFSYFMLVGTRASCPFHMKESRVYRWNDIAGMGTGKCSNNPWSNENAALHELTTNFLRHPQTPNHVFVENLPVKPYFGSARAAPGSMVRIRIQSGFNYSPDSIKIFWITSIIFEVTQ